MLWFNVVFQAIHFDVYEWHILWKVVASSPDLDLTTTTTLPLICIYNGVCLDFIYNGVCLDFSCVYSYDIFFHIILLITLWGYKWFCELCWTGIAGPTHPSVALHNWAFKSRLHACMLCWRILTPSSFSPVWVPQFALHCSTLPLGFCRMNFEVPFSSVGAIVCYMINQYAAIWHRLQCDESICGNMTPFAVRSIYMRQSLPEYATSLSNPDLHSWCDR